MGLLLALYLATPPLHASASQGSPPESSAGGSDALTILKNTAEFLARSPQFSVTIRDGYDVVQASGQKVEFGEVRKVVLKRPDLFRSDIVRSDGEKGLVLFNGKDIVVSHELKKVYAKSPSPGDLDGAITFLVSDLGMRIPLAMLFLSRLPVEIDKRVKSAEIVEQSGLMDVPCTQLAVRSDEVDFQIWVPSKGDPLPRRIVITYKNDRGAPQFWANFSDWNLSPNPSNALFDFTPDEGAKQIPFLLQLQLAKPKAVRAATKKKGGAQ